VAIADNPIEVRLQQAKEGLDTDIGRDLARVTIAGILSFIPGIGSAIQSLVDGKAHRNVERRWIQLFVDLKDQLEKIRDSIRTKATTTRRNSRRFSLSPTNNYGPPMTAKSSEC
jgi:hypothetical protein